MPITINSYDYSVFGNKSAVIADLSFDSNYQPGGDTLDFKTALGLHQVDLTIIEPVGRYSFKFDAATRKVRVFAPAPPIVYEEKHVPSGESAVQTIATKYPPAFFMNAARIAGNKKFRSTGVAPGDDEISLNAQMVDGERATLSVKDYDRLAGQGGFAADTGWTGFAEADWTCADNKAKKGADGTTALTHGTAAVGGAKYHLAFTVDGLTAGSFTPSIGSTDGDAVSADGDYEMVLTAADTAALIFTPTNDSRFNLSNVKVYKLDEPVYLTYVTQAWKEVWDNLVQDEGITLSSSATTGLENPACAIMYADRISATAKALALIDEDDTAASGEVAICLNQAADNIKASHADENGKSVLVTYIKNPGSGFLCDRAFGNEEATKAGADPYTNTFDYPIVLWGYCGQVPCNGGQTQRLIPFAGTPAAGTGVIDWHNPGTRGAGAPAAGTVIGLKSNLTATGAGIWGTINEIATIPIEVADADLSALTSVKALFIGL